MPTVSVPPLEASLDRVREGLEARARLIAGRIGERLAGFVSRPGKMLRARFCVHLGAALDVPAPQAEACGRVAELVHNASLLHDDCVDEATTRRGRATPNHLFGATTAILLGDLAFTQAMDGALALSVPATQGLVEAVREMTVGELQEEFLRGSLSVTEDSYYGVAARKTGALFEWCGRAMSDLSPLDHDREAMPELGRTAGILLQVVDDIQDYTLAGVVSGKDPAKDLAGSRLTLPALLALRDPETTERFTALWRDGASRPEAASELRRLLEEHGHLEEARAKARELLERMLVLVRALPSAAEGRAMAGFIEAMARRQF